MSDALQEALLRIAGRSHEDHATPRNRTPRFQVSYNIGRGHYVLTCDAFDYPDLPTGAAVPVTDGVLWWGATVSVVSSKIVRDAAEIAETAALLLREVFTKLLEKV